MSTQLAKRILSLLALLVLAALGSARGAAAQESSCGIVAYEWKGAVEENDRGFPRNQPPPNNFDWTSPVNYAGGTAHFYARVISQPTPQDNMRLQQCWWQSVGDDRFALETCGRLNSVPGSSNAAVTWEQSIGDMFKKGGNPLEWNRGRYRTAVAVKYRDESDPNNPVTVPVSDFNNWNWYGQDPQDWYPLNMVFVTRVVPPGVTFDGWDACLEPVALDLTVFGARQPATGWLVAPLLLLAASALLALLRRRF